MPRSLCVDQDLSSQEADAFRELKTRCEKEGLFGTYDDALGDRDTHYGIDDEITLLRFLCAWKFNVEDAYRQFSNVCSERKANKVYDFYENMDVDLFQETLNLYSQWTGRRSKLGLPVLIFDVGKLSSKTMTDWKNSSESIALPKLDAKDVTLKLTAQQMRSIAVHDNLTRFIFPLCSAVTARPEPTKPISKTVHIVDVSGLGLMQFWKLRSHILNFNHILAKYFPEILDRVFIVGAPSYFPTLWTWVKKWIDPITVAKLIILNPQDMLPTLESYIELENIPKMFGGELDYEPGMPLVLDSTIIEILKWQEAEKHASSLPLGRGLPLGPLKWETSSATGSMVAIAVGSSKGVVRHEQFAEIGS